MSSEPGNLEVDQLLSRARAGDEAAQLFGKLATTSQAAVCAEHRLIVQEALNGMAPIDREVLTLRHFEHLSNDETAPVLGLTRSAASNRCIRALKRLKQILAAIPGLKEHFRS